MNSHLQLHLIPPITWPYRGSDALANAPNSMSPVTIDGKFTRRTGQLVARCPTARTLVMHPTVVGTVQHFLSHVTAVCRGQQEGVGDELGFQLAARTQQGHVTGLQLADEIRASHPGVALILATGYAELPGGSDPHLTRLAKPFLQDDLARALQEALARG